MGESRNYLRNLTSWLSPVVKSSNSLWKRCWCASVDGWAASTFHSRCDAKGPTVTIIRVGRYIFGGYTSVSWGKWASDAGRRRTNYKSYFTTAHLLQLNPSSNIFYVFLHFFRSILVRNLAISSSVSRERFRHLFEFIHTKTAALLRRSLETRQYTIGWTVSCSHLRNFVSISWLWRISKRIKDNQKRRNILNE